MSGGGARIAVRVAEVTEVNALIRRIRFVRPDGGPMPAFSGGAHTVVEMDDHGTRRRNPYSLMGDPADTTGYSISVRRDDAGRGGSLFLHRHVVPGMDMVISHPVNLFALDLRAKKHLMIAGGIGITPFLAQIAQLAALGGRFELHYATRNPALCAYGDELAARYGGRGSSSSVLHACVNVAQPAHPMAHPGPGGAVKQQIIRPASATSTHSVGPW